jgi:hypothetical protein
MTDHEDASFHEGATAWGSWLSQLAAAGAE